MADKKEIEELGKTITKLSNVIAILATVVFILGSLLFYYGSSSSEEKDIKQPEPDEFGNFTKAEQQKAKALKESDIYWHAPQLSELENNPEKDIILYGKDLIAHTSNYFGPKGKLVASATNGMNCQNCHLDAGTKVFGNNYSAVASTYPKYRARSGSIENIYKRVNDCFERSLNGKGLDTNSKEMQAIVAYIYWLGKNVEKGKKPEGSGLKELTFLKRACDPEKGKTVYMAKCKTCHQPDGNGLMNADKSAYTYPPLWGPNSYNDGAGLYRLSAFAKYVKNNMPLEVTYLNTQLSDEEVWDVAAFVNSQPRPKKDIKFDWPKIEEKPADHPFGPFADKFTIAQHKYGPFEPIAEFKKKHKNR